MLIANNWKEYELLDCGDGLKLEKWGNDKEAYILSRPDPQVMWPKEKESLWTKADAIYTRNNQGGGGWKFKRQIPSGWSINYNDLKFFVRPTDFKHTGLFPEQAVNWDWITERIKSQKSKVKILNLFAYTGAATIASAKAGAEVTHVDSAKGMVEWASENAKLNNVSARWIVDDVFKFVAREKKRGIKYDALIMDPPSYGRGTAGETWKIERMLWPLVKASVEMLSPNPLFFLINSYSTGIGATVIGNVLDSALKNHGGKITFDEIVIPINESKKVLPAGVCGRWVAD